MTTCRLKGCNRPARHGEYCSRVCADYDNAVIVRQYKEYADDFMLRRTIKWGPIIRKWGPLAALCQTTEGLE